MAVWGGGAEAARRKKVPALALAPQAGIIPAHSIPRVGSSSSGIGSDIGSGSGSGSGSA